jgi:hypothetical protein
MILAQADEIKFQYKDRERILDYIEGYSNKTFIIDIPKEEEIDDWDFLNMLNEKTNIVLGVRDLKIINGHDFKFYWAYPITSYYELQGILALNPYYIFIGAPLSFDLERIHNMTGVYVRMCPNVAYDSYIPRTDGICGQWVRPEDTKHYEPYVNTFEFITDGLEKERTLLHIYKDNEEWPGNLDILITNLKVDVDNRAIPDEFGPIRLRCGQRCMQYGSCHYCYSAIKFAEKLREKHLEMQQEKEN